jgi:hypothetical protein
MLLSSDEVSMGDVDSIILEYLRHIRGAIDDIRDDIREMKHRLGILESQYSSLSVRMDRMDLRIEGIERRLDLIEV